MPTSGEAAWNVGGPPTLLRWDDTTVPSFSFFFRQIRLRATLNPVRVQSQAGMDEQPTDAEWRNWLDRHSPGFGLFARQKVHSEMDAQDLVQEAILEAAKRAAPALPTPALVFATIHRRAIDRARRENRRAARELSAATDQPVVWFDVTPEERERAQLIQGALSKLPEPYREVIALKVWSDLTFGEIGEALNIPPNTAASRYRYGLQELRKLTKEVFT